MDRPAVKEKEPRGEDSAGGKSSADPLYVVGIGTSSGGLAALRTLFAELPPTLGVAYVVVMHLSPDHKSYLDELLQISTSMPVRQVRSTERLLPNHIFVIPPNANLDTIDTHLRLSQLEERRIERAPIDHFLRTLARTHKAHAIGVILAGTGSDGALGIRQIKEQRGLTIAQDPVEAACDSMPRAAIGTGTIDLILRLRDIPDNIARYCATRPQLPGLDEELRSILAELESSKAELQAANEELIALDADNRRRIAELGQISGELKHLLASTGIAMLFLDRELKIVRFTPQLGELFHVRAGDRGRSLSGLTHGLRYDGLHEDALAVIADVEPREREVESAEGRWYVARMLPYRSPRNVVDGVVLALIDITDRKRAEDKLRLADRRKDEFLALLAHELRNPLAPIVAGVDVLKMTADDPAMVEKVAATIGRQTQQLVRLVDDLLEVSRISGGRLKLSKARVLLQDVIRDSVATVRPIVDRAGHELSTTVTPEPIVVEGDSARLTQALGNLLNNAVRYTPRGGRISLTALRENTKAVITVEDNGIGIPDDILPRVFEMFYQGDNSRAGRNVGLGIGLTLAKSLVEMHGGTIDVESDGDNRGSRFTIRLATATEMATEGATAELTVTSGASEHPRSSGRRVLVVDDNKDAAETLCMLLQTLGDNDVRLALNGADALRIADTQQPDIAFLDLKMPEMDGYEVARRIREQPWGGGAMLIALTGFGQEDHKRRTREAGFDRHLTKPAGRAAVEAVLSEAPRAAGAAG